MLCQIFCLTDDIFVQAINSIVFAQIMALVGSGVLSQPMMTLFGDTSKAFWCSGILNICIVALNPPLAQAADYWGRKWILVVCSACGFIGLMMVSRANTVVTALAGFTLTGIAVSPQFALYAVVSEIVPRKHRAWAQVTVGVSTGIGAIVAVLMAGALLRYNILENYRTFFYVAAGVYGLGTLGVLVGYNPPRRQEETYTLSQKVHRLDLPGIFLISSGLTLFALGMSFYGSDYTFQTVKVLAPFIIGIVLLSLFGLYSWLIRKDGIANHRLFQKRNFPLACFIAFAEGVTFFTFNSYFVYEQIAVMGSDTWTASLRALVFYGVSIVIVFVAGAYTTWTKRLSDPLILGFVVYVAFCAAMTTVKPTTSSAAICGFAFLAALGNGFVLLNTTVAAQLATPKDLIAVTSGLQLATRGFGGAVGIVVNGAVLSSTLEANLGPRVAAAVLPLGFPVKELGALIGALLSGNPALVVKIPGVTPAMIGAAVTAMHETYAVSFRKCWIIAASFCGVALISE
jgi:MFS family permease